MNKRMILATVIFVTSGAMVMAQPTSKEGPSLRLPQSGTKGAPVQSQETPKTTKFSNTTLSVEHRTKLINEIAGDELTNGFQPKPFDDLAMDGWQRAPPPIPPRGKMGRASGPGDAAADAAATPARPESCS